MYKKIAVYVGKYKYKIFKQVTVVQDKDLSNVHKAVGEDEIF